MDCIFCKIVSGEVPALKVYEDEEYIAFLDINPRSKGHTLIIPKKHYETLLDMREEIKSLGEVIKHISSQLVSKLNAQGFNVLNNNGEAAGQVVKHVHFHIIPRYGEKGHSLESAFPVDEEAKEKIEEVYKEIGSLPALERKVEKAASIQKEEPLKKNSQKEENEGYEGEIFDEIDALKDY